MHFQAKGTLEKHPAPQCQTPKLAWGLMLSYGNYALLISY
jgi:hypothetical protein